MIENVLAMNKLRTHYEARLQENVVMANYTTSRVGGIADALIVVNSTQELESACRLIWELEIPLHILGNASNVLISDSGLDGVVVFNRSHNIKIEINNDPPTIWAESGANLSNVARQAAVRGLSGMEWAAIIPGTVGGSVYGNAGAFNASMNSTLVMAEILQPNCPKEYWPIERLEFEYRTSYLKRHPGKTVITAALLHLTRSTPEAVQSLMSTYTGKRHTTQPPGASMGSTFKNPPNDYAGRLIEAAGLKGTRMGGVEISPVHANFLINVGGATATSYLKMIRFIQNTIKEQFNVELQLEIEFLGDWEEMD